MLLLSGAWGPAIDLLQPISMQARDCMSLRRCGCRSPMEWLNAAAVGPHKTKQPQRWYWYVKGVTGLLESKVPKSMRGKCTTQWGKTVDSDRYRYAEIAKHINSKDATRFSCHSRWQDYRIGTARKMSVDIDATPDLFLIPQKLRIVQYRYGSLSEPFCHCCSSSFVHMSFVE